MGGTNRRSQPVQKLRCVNRTRLVLGSLPRNDVGASVWAVRLNRSRLESG